MHNQYWAQLYNNFTIRVNQFKAVRKALPFILMAAFYQGTLPKREHPRLVWGAMAILNNAYWSNAMKKIGYDSRTLMHTYASTINKKDDYDFYTDDLVVHQGEVVEHLLEILPKVARYVEQYKFHKRYKFLNPGLKFLLKQYAKRLRERLESAKQKIAANKNEYSFDFNYDFYVFIYAILNYDIFHHSFLGGYLCYTGLAPFESHLLKLANKKVVTLPFGGDAHRYSLFEDNILKHTLLMDYPLQGRIELQIQKKVDQWIENSDIVVTGHSTEGFGRWDAFPFSALSIDTELWQPKTSYSFNNGINGPVKIMHTPNHRGVKGTEYIFRAVDALREEGLQIEMILLEKIQNTEVRRLMKEEADILLEQLIRGYGLSGVEGMASGLPVISRLGDDINTRAFRHYSYLNECPIVTTSVESIKDDLRELITNPELRKVLGEAGRQYVEKYHSEESCQYMFSSIYDKIWYEKPVDLMNLFNPLTSEFNHRKPLVQHPLIDNFLPKTKKKAEAPRDAIYLS
jgi:glycosyltransferase involved in cell wall biosynthesis